MFVPGISPKKKALGLILVGVLFISFAVVMYGRITRSTELVLIGASPVLIGIVSAWIWSKRDPAFAKRVADAKLKQNGGRSAWASFCNKFVWVIVPVTVVWAMNMARSGWNISSMSLPEQITATLILVAFAIVLIELARGAASRRG
jgi:hypothetical protein